MSPEEHIDCRPPLALAGPTATGKSEVAILLAERMGGEIISVDSMQVYRGLDIGTAKPSVADRARVRHHLVDVVELSGSFDAAQFVRLAHRAVAEISARGRLPIFCGGTGLYFKAFLHGLGTAPASNADLRAELEGTDLAALLAELAEKDPVTYGHIDRKNPRRVIRALEVIRLMGRPFSEQKAVWREAAETASADGSGKTREGCVMAGIARSPEELRRRIVGRVEEMFRRGLVEETRQLLAQGLERNRTAMQALGYRQVVEHLRGDHSVAETIELVKTRTRQFAKRQMTWFRRQLAVNWINVGAAMSASEIATQILAAYRGTAQR